MPNSELAEASRLRYQPSQMSSAGPILSDPRYLELKDRFAGILVLVGAMAACVCFSFWAKEVARPELLLRRVPVTTRGIVGWPHAVDALATLEAARRSSRPRELRQITLEGVKSDGTIDVVTGPGSLTYLFHNGVKKPKPKKPNDSAKPEKSKLEKSKAERPPHCPRQVVRVRHDGLDPQSELKDDRCSDVSGGYEPLPIPSCGPKQLWARAIAKGASIQQLAHIEYYRSKAGPAWKMSLPRDRMQIAVSSDCQRELDRLQAAAIPE